MSITTYPLNGIEYDATNAETYLCTRTSGVYADDDCFDISITDDMEVTISPGIAWIKNADYTGKSVCVDEDVAITLSLGSGSYPRTDRIVLRFDKTANESVLDVLEGDASSSATPPDITQSEYTYELGLYEIYIPAGTTELSADYITDTRTDEDVCGIMSDGVTGIPTATLYAQWQAWYESVQEEASDAYDDYTASLAEYLATYNESFESWFENIKDQLSEDSAGNLQVEIDELETRLALLETMVLTNSYSVPIETGEDDLTLLTDDLGYAIMADWKYETA